MDLKPIKEQVIQLAMECGEFMQTEAKSFDYSKVEFKGKNDLVSYVDKELEIQIVKRLKEILPEAGFLTEEGTVAQDTNPLKWVIDPLDGTTNFIHGLPVYSTSIALIDGNDLLVGVVNDPNRNECFHAYIKVEVHFVTMMLWPFLPWVKLKIVYWQPVFRFTILTN